MITIKDVAKKAGVSISTVSYALNNSDKVALKTKARIQAIAKELKYIPNASGRNLKQKATKMLGFFAEDYTGLYFYGPILKGMRDEMNKKGYELIICSGKKSRFLIPQGIVDGAIILNGEFSNKDLLNYADRNHKIIVMDRKLEHENIKQVTLNNEKGIFKSFDYAYKLGHRIFYYISGSEGNFDAYHRLKAMREIAKQYPDVTLHEKPYCINSEEIEEVMEGILDEYSSPICVFSFNDDLSIKIHSYITKTNFVIGEHIHLVGFDNIEMAEFIQPSLTTINIPKEEWGIIAAQKLLKMVEGKEPIHTEIDVDLIKRSSINQV